MAKLIVLTRNGTETEIEGHAGISVMEIVRNAGFEEMLAACGGCCSCATCHVFVDRPAGMELPSISSTEDELLGTSAHRAPNSRLACQLVFSEAMDGLRVQIAPED